MILSKKFTAYLLWLSSKLSLVFLLSCAIFKAFGKIIFWKDFRIMLFSHLGEISLIAIDMVVDHVSKLIFDAIEISIWLKCENEMKRKNKKQLKFS